MKSKQYAKRLLSLIIASVMILTMLPVSALASGADDVMIEDQAETIVEEAADVSGEVVEEAAEVPDIEESEDAVIVEESVDEIAEADPEELAGDSETRSFTAQGVPSGSKMRFNAQLTGLTVSAVVPATRAAKGSVMTADIVDVRAYEDAIAKKNYGKSITGLYGLELHFYDKKGKPIKHINTSDITVTVDGLEASSYFIGSIENNVKTLQRGTEPKFTFTAKKAYTKSYAYTYVIAGLRDDGLVRAFGEADGDGNKRFNLNDENVNIEVVAPEDAFADGVAMEASDVTNGTTLGAADGDDALVGASSDEVVAAYEISFYNEEGDEQQPSKEVTVSVNVPLDVTKGYELIHIADDGTRNTVIGAKFTENGVEFKADSFSVYAVVVPSITSGQQYVIYSGTGNNNALAYNNNNQLANATVSVSNNTLNYANDNIKWTFESVSGSGYRIYFKSGNNTYYLTTTSGNNPTLTLATTSSSARTWYYDKENKHLYYVTSSGFFNQNRYVRELNGNRRTTTNSDSAAGIILALVTDEIPSGEFSYNYYKADSSEQIAASEVVTPSEDWTPVSALAKQIPGYIFLEARANSKDGNVISQVKGNSYRLGTENTGDGSYLSSIYFLYMSKYTSSGSVPEGLKGPELDKKVTDNGDGTFKIRLDIKGVTNNVKHGANVVVVFDRTSSMSGNMNGPNTGMRINAAISAVTAMVNTLQPPTSTDQNDIDYALVEFDRSAEIHDFVEAGINGHTSWTKSGSALVNYIEQYRDGENLAASGATVGGGGTNWQEALQKTAAILEDKPDNDVTYVVFMTDGEPTFYIDSDEVRNQRSISDPEYTKAVPYATAIVDADYHMWDIFCSAADTSLLRSLKEDSEADAYIEAATTEAIEEAFVSVANAMLEAISSQNNAANDGVPKMGSFDLDTVDGQVQLSNAKYYKTPNNGTQTEWTDAPPATPSDVGVKWDLSSVEPLEDGTVYSVEFDIWPSQYAYDLIADLNNHVKEFEAGSPNSITDEERAQVKLVEGTTDQYTMQTNTSLNMSYKLYGQDHSDNYPDYDRDDMELPTETITIEKIWPPVEVMNQLDNYGRFAYRGTDGEVHYADEMNLTLWRGDVAYITDLKVKAPTATPTPEPGNPGEVTEGSQVWDNQGIKVYISCGNMVEKDGVVTVHETGHDYSLTEPEEFSYFWDLMSDTYHPMVINGVTTMLAEVDSHDVPASMPAGDIKYEAGGTVYYRFNNKVYKVTSDTNCVLQGTNYRRSNLNLTKTISGVRPTDDYFEYEAVVTSSTNEKIWFSATINGPDAETPEYYMDADWVISGANREIDSTTGQPTGFWYAESGATIRFKIKDGWNVRFLNLYHGTTFSFQEIDDTTDNYVFDSVGADKRFDFMNGNIGKDSWYTIDAETDAHITGTIVEPNNKYTVTYTNKCNYFFVYHSGTAGDGNLERMEMPEEGGTANIISNLTEGTLYGGYYLDYAGKGTYNDDGVKGEGGVVYNGMNYDWSDAQTVDATAMTPVAGETYYIKEVPTYYLRNYHQITYKKIDGYLTGLYLISAIDDLNYQETGFTLKSDDDQKATKVVTQMLIKNVTTGTTVTLKANIIFKTLGITQAGEYLSYYDATENDDYFTKGTFTVLPYWITPDGITVHGISTRTITINAMTRAGITKEDSE